MQDPPQVDPVFTFHIEEQVGIAANAPEPQLRQIKLMSIAGRAGSRMPGHMTQGVFKRIDESAGDNLAAVAR